MLERVDVHAANRNPVFQKFAAEHRNRYRQAAELLRPFAPLTVVDAACGCGYGYEHLKDLGCYVGLDVDPAAIDADRRFYPGVDFRVADLDGPDPFAGLTPGAIISFETAEHLADPVRFLAECYAALPPRGLFVFSAPTSLTMDFDPYHKRDWDDIRWRAALKLVGWTITYERRMGFVMRFADFLHTTPTTWRQKGRIGRFLLTHPRYLADRLWNWGLRNRFEWSSHLFFCVKEFP